MEETDEFINEYCKLLECSFSKKETIEFETSQVFEFMIRSIWKIDPSSQEKIPSYVYPRHIAERLRLASTISKCLEKLNIRGDIGFHNILYGSANSLRTIFLEIIKKLPSTLNEMESETLDSRISLQKLGHEPSWVPDFCRNLNFYHDGHYWCPPENLDDWFPFSSKEKFGIDCEELNLNSALIEREKPVIPPKPKFLSLLNQTEIEEKNELSLAYLLKLKYDIIYEQFQTEHQKLLELLKANKTLQENIDNYDARLIEALQNPEYYINELVRKIDDINEKLKNDVDKANKARNEANETLKTVLDECKAKGKETSDEEKLEEIQAQIEQLDLECENDKILIEKLKSKIDAEKIDDDFFSLLGKRCREMEELVKKQENDLQKIIDDRQNIWRRIERENDSLSRSFSLIYNVLAEYVEMYHGQQALESFIRINLYCTEMFELVFASTEYKTEIEIMRDEVDAESRNDYDKQCKLIEKDIKEIELENEALLELIHRKDPNFKIAM